MHPPSFNGPLRWMPQGSAEDLQPRMRLPSCHWCSGSTDHWSPLLSVLAVVASPSAIHWLAPAGSLYSTFAACYLKMAGDDMELGASFQKQVDKAYMGQQKAATPPGAADVSVIPEPHLNHPDIRDNGLFQVRQ